MRLYPAAKQPGGWPASREASVSPRPRPLAPRLPRQGLIFRSVREVFDALGRVGLGKTGADGSRLEVSVAFLELYNETVRDLLQDGGTICKVLEDERRGVVKVQNLREVPVEGCEEALRQLRIGNQLRKVEATASNSRSSRSHAVFSLTVERVDPAPAGPGHAVFNRKGAEPRRLHSRISLIDLAGSERATQTQNVGAALRDGAKINQSLLALANCIDALILRGREGQATPRKKAPYRDSKLTLLLKASLCSNTFISMIANVHPGQTHFEDSNNTLEYAKRASVVKAPVIIRRTREGAPWLPVSRPPSPTPSASPGPGDDEADVGPAAEKDAARVAPQAQMDLQKRRRTIEGGHRGEAGDGARGGEAPPLARSHSAAAIETREPSGVTTRRYRLRPRLQTENGIIPGLSQQEFCNHFSESPTNRAKLKVRTLEIFSPVFTDVHLLSPVDYVHVLVFVTCVHMFVVSPQDWFPSSVGLLFSQSKVRIELD